MRFPMVVALAAAMIAVAATKGLDAAEAAVLCQKKSGAIVVRAPACKKKETPFDVSPFVAAAPAVTELTNQVTSVDHELDALKAMGPLVAGQFGTVAGYANVAANGQLSESFTQHGSVTSGATGTADYVINFGFTLRQTQAILVTPRGIATNVICEPGEIFSTFVYVSCSAATQFTVVVFN